MRTIILYWMRWTWKSSIWKILAKDIWALFIDLDKYIEEKLWEKIIDLVEKRWWKYFRDKENFYLKEVLKIEKKKVLSLWWWTIVYKRNQKHINTLKEKDLFFIKTNLKNIEKRIIKDEKNEEKRPSITKNSIIKELEILYKKRLSIYKENSHKTINNNSDIKKATKSIKNYLKKKTIWVSIDDFDNKSLEKTIKSIEKDKKISFIEFRLDKKENLDLKDIKSYLNLENKKTIATIRTKQEWWNYKSDENKLINTLKKALNLGVSYIDLELNILEKIKDKSSLDKVNFKKVIISHHNFTKSYSIKEYKNILEKMDTYKPAVYKIASKGEKEKDIKNMFKLSEFFKENYVWKEFIFISMWNLWKETREAMPRVWSYISFSWYKNSLQAPWQTNYKELYKKI